MLEGLLIGLQTTMSFQNLAMVIAGCLIGTFIGMLPGLGPMSIIAIMIPIAISMGDPSAALILLAGVYYGAIFGGSTSSILLNAPGVAGTAASSFDGYVLKPKVAGTADSEIKDMRITRAEARAFALVIGRQSIQGFFIGVLPGTGATIASFLGYAVERNLATKDEQAQFGKGAIKGLVAPETANNAACTGSFVPLLTLGIPGSGTTAILLGALIALNVSPGPRLMIDEPQIFWAVIMSMFIGNLVLLVLNLPLIPYIAKVLSIPRNFLIPFILFFTLMGAYIGQNNATELLILVGSSASSWAVC
jgi:TctA family transporter